jgi:hypothetical protein
VRGGVPLPRNLARPKLVRIVLRSDLALLVVMLEFVKTAAATMRSESGGWIGRSSLSETVAAH